MRLPLLVAAAALSACSVFDPNPGETEADVLIQNKQYREAMQIVEPQAQRGIPWAQLRLGIAYEYGQGKPRNIEQALHWYLQAAVQEQSLPWADGVHLISTGDKGYFNQNNDARVAQYLIARLYASNESGLDQDLEAAWLWIQHVSKSSEGSDILFCCENSRLKTQKIRYERIDQLRKSIENRLAPDTLEKLKTQSDHWRPSK